MASAILAAVSVFAQAFSGTWTCYFQREATPWRIAPAPAASWTIVRWGDQHSAAGGIAYVGDLPAMHAWVYRDFHYDGSYADITSPGPHGHTWTWSGPYYTPKAVLQGNVTWALTTPNRIDRTFRAPAHGKLIVTGRDFCVRAAAGTHPR